MKLHDYMFAITLITIGIFYGAWHFAQIDNRQLVYPVHKVYVNYGSFDRADLGEIDIVNERGSTVFPGNPIETQWKITNTDDKPWSGWVTLVVDKADRSIISYMKFEDISGRISLEPGETKIIKILGFIDPNITLTSLQQRYTNRSIIINLALYEDTPFMRLFWETRSVYYHYKYFDTAKNDFTDQHYEEIPKKCEKVLEQMTKQTYLPWVCSQVDFQKPAHLSKISLKFTGPAGRYLGPDGATADSYDWFGTDYGYGP